MSKKEAKADGLKPTEFKDSKGNVWDCALDLATVRDIDDADCGRLTETPITLVRDPSQAVYMEILVNDALLAFLIWIVVTSTGQHRCSDPSSDEDQREWLRGFNGQTIADARSAFWEALADFFPESREGLLMCREAVKEMRQEMTSLIYQRRERVLTKGRKALAEAAQNLEEELDRDLKGLTAGGKSGGS